MLDGTIDSPNVDIPVKLIETERLERLHQCSLLNTHCKLLIYALYVNQAEGVLSVSYVGKRRANESGLPTA